MSNVQQAGRVEYFRLPDAGEGLTEAEIVTWRVRPGDTVALNQIIVEVETAKALTELPCPFAGTVTELLVPEGTMVPVGTPIIAVATAPTSPAPTPAPTSPVIMPTSTGSAPAPGPAEAAVEPGLIGGPAPGGRTSVLVGYGPRTTSAVRRRRLPSAAAPTTPTPTPTPTPTTTPTTPIPTPTPTPAPPPPAVIMHASTGSAATAGGVVHVLAKPPVRKLARDLGVDLGEVPATGPAGLVTREDVEQAAAAHAPLPAPLLTPEQAVDPGGQTRIPIRGVRKLTAEAMVASAFTAPHVTEWLTVDVTRTMRLVGRLRDDREFTEVKVSPLLVVAKALLISARRHPEINATWDAAAGEIVIHHDVNLGIAAATPRGLVVPNIKDAGRLTLRELAEALANLTATAKQGRTAAAALTGGTITITNVGVFGVDSGTPILNPGEAAILAFGQVRRMPWVHKGKVRPRWVTQLAVSFDHRLVDGDLGSRFLADLGAVLEDPTQALAWT